MVVRYPHTATVTVSGATMVNGEYSSSNPANTTIKGRLDASGGNKRVKDPNGEYTEVTGTFFTKAEKVEGAETLTVDGRTYKILRWFLYQTYAEIWLD